MEKQNIDFANCDEAELKTVMDYYGHALLRYCHNILCDYHEAQDALQTTFIKAYYKRGSFKESSALSPWLYKIAYTTCVDILRKKKLKLTYYLPSQPVESEHIPDEVLNCLKVLNTTDRALVYARVMEDKPYEELAKIHGKSTAALRKRYEHAKSKLTEVLKEEYPDYAGLEESK